MQGVNCRGSQIEIGDMTITKTLSIPMDRDKYEYLNEISKAERTDLSKAVRVWLHLAEFGVESSREKEDYL
jgi:hypothetical protein